VDRAVAKTRMPWAANSRARAFPTPPREHLLEVMFSSVNYDKKRCKLFPFRVTYPVIRIERFGEVILPGYKVEQ
jgi:hypothetical protein